MEMASKKQEYYRENLLKVRGMWYYILLVMVVTVTAGLYLQKVPSYSDHEHEGIIDLYSQRFPKYLDQNESSVGNAFFYKYIVSSEYAAQLPGTVARNIQECFITLAIKFLNFCIAKSLQFRYSMPLLLSSPSAISSLVFWIALTRSVFSLYY